MRVALLLSLLACGSADSDLTEAAEPPSAPAVPADFAGFDDTPAELGVTAWLKGEAIDPASAQLVLVEHWATWCGPCKEQMPHLTELQAEHGDKLTIVGISDEEAKIVKPFLAKNEAKMGYTVAIAPKDAMKEWSGWAQAGGIPYSYLVQHGKVLWHGHPMGLDRVLPKALDGAWTADLAAAHAAMPKAAKAYVAAIESGTAEEAREAAQPMLDHPEIGASAKNEIAWGILTDVPEEKRDLELAVTLAKQATAEAEHEDMALEDTLGLALFMSGEVEEAIEVQSHAVKLCADQNGPEALCTELSDRLAEFKASAEG